MERQQVKEAFVEALVETVEATWKGAEVVEWMRDHIDALMDLHGEDVDLERSSVWRMMETVTNIAAHDASLIDPLELSEDDMGRMHNNMNLVGKEPVMHADLNSDLYPWPGQRGRVWPEVIWLKTHDDRMVAWHINRGVEPPLSLFQTVTVDGA